MFKIRLKYAIPEIDGTLYEVGTTVSHSNEEDELPEKLHHSSCEEASEAQKAQRQRFTEARAYADTAMADPQICLLYQKRAAQENRNPHRVAMADYLLGINLLEKK